MHGQDDRPDRAFPGAGAARPVVLAPLANGDWTKNSALPVSLRRAQLIMTACSYDFPAGLVVH